MGDFATILTDLKERQRALRANFPESLGLRVHRAISWITRADAAQNDLDVRFILSWIAFNAAYAADLHDGKESERESFQYFFEILVSLDGDQEIYSMVWKRFPHEIRMLLDNPYVFAPFWAFHNGTGAANWPEKLSQAKARMNVALGKRDTGMILSMLFDRLYVLRNQLVHGGATWNSSVNRDQLRDACAILMSLLPIFIDIMMAHPNRPWGAAHYPVVSA